MHTRGHLRPHIFWGVRGNVKFWIPTGGGRASRRREYQFPPISPNPRPFNGRTSYGPLLIERSSLCLSSSCLILDQEEKPKGCLLLPLGSWILGRSITATAGSRSPWASCVPSINSFIRLSSPFLSPSWVLISFPSVRMVKFRELVRSGWRRIGGSRLRCKAAWRREAADLRYCQRYGERRGEIWSFRALFSLYKCGLRFHADRFWCVDRFLPGRRRISTLG